MTAQNRDDLNDAELAWAAADASMASAMQWLLGARETLVLDQPGHDRAAREAPGVDPAVLRAWGGL